MKLTNDFLQEQIQDVSYAHGRGTITHCYITVKNGFIFTGESACVDANNFDAKVGKKVAYENAFEKMWAAYGFLLKDQISDNPTLLKHS